MRNDWNLLAFARAVNSARAEAARLWERTRLNTHGYAAIDAMVALLILSLSTVLSFRAIEQAQQATLLAVEYRAANALITDLIQEAPRTFEPAAGARNGFRWTVETQLTGADRPIEICRRSVVLRSEKTPRSYQASTLEICPQLAA